MALVSVKYEIGNDANVDHNIYGFIDQGVWSKAETFCERHNFRAQAGTLILNKRSPLQAKPNEYEAVIAQNNLDCLSQRSGMIIGGVAIGFNAIKVGRVATGGLTHTDAPPLAGDSNLVIVTVSRRNCCCTY